MEAIKNVPIGNFDIDPIILCTTGVSSCFVSVIELENKVFIYHIDPNSFNATRARASGPSFGGCRGIFSREISKKKR